MQKNDLFRCGNDIFRVLDVSQNEIFVINCTRKTMPQWCDLTTFSDYKACTEDDLLLQRGVVLTDVDMLFPTVKRVIHERYTNGQCGLRFEIDKKRISIRLTAPYSEDRRMAASALAKNRGIHNR